MSDLIETVASLARRCKRHRGTVTRWLKREDWPVRQVPPWSDDDVTAIESWMEYLQEDRAAEPEPDAYCAALITDAYPELLDAQYRRELDAYLLAIDGEPPDPDAARARLAAKLRQRAAALE